MRTLKEVDKLIAKATPEQREQLEVMLQGVLSGKPPPKARTTKAKWSKPSVEELVDRDPDDDEDAFPTDQDVIEELGFDPEDGAPTKKNQKKK
jgi:hypothetical protein